MVRVSVLRRGPVSAAKTSCSRSDGEARERRARRSDRIDARVVARRVAWDWNANALSRGDLSSQPAAVIAEIAALEAVTLLAKALGKSPLVIAIALVARMADSR